MICKFHEVSVLFPNYSLQKSLSLHLPKLSISLGNKKSYFSSFPCKEWKLKSVSTLVWATEQRKGVKNFDLFILLFFFLSPGQKTSGLSLIKCISEQFLVNVNERIKLLFLSVTQVGAGSPRLHQSTLPLWGVSTCVASTCCCLGIHPASGPRGDPVVLSLFPPCSQETHCFLKLRKQRQGQDRLI